MATSPTAPDDEPAAPARRRYDSPVRRQRAEETRERIVAAGSELVHDYPSWDWSELTFRAVAERAGVGERTVYRHFPTERHLHDAVMARLEVEAGIDYESVDRDNLLAVTAKVFASLHAFAVADSVHEPVDPTFVAVDERRRAAVRRCVVEATPGWDDADRETVAALLDVLWNLPAYERLAGAWRLDGERASGALTWLMGLVLRSIESGERPT